MALQTRNPISVHGGVLFEITSGVSRTRESTGTASLPSSRSWPVRVRAAGRLVRAAHDRRAERHGRRRVRAVVPGADVTLTNEASATRPPLGNERRAASSPSRRCPRAPTRSRVASRASRATRSRASRLRGGDSRSLRQIALKVADHGRDRLGHRRRRPHAAELRREERDPHRRADREHPDRRHERGRAAEGPAGHDADHRASTTGPTSRARSSASTATASTRRRRQQPERDRQLLRQRHRAPRPLDITIDGAPGADPGCNCATSVNPNTEIVQEFKVLQSNFGAEHAKGPVAMTVVSKSGGRDFHGSALHLPAATTT